MRYLKMPMMLVWSLVLALLLGVAGCGEDHGDRFRGDHDRYESHDNDRHDDHRDSDRHEDRGGDSGHGGDHGER